jgi:hypothetical protein
MSQIRKAHLLLVEPNSIALYASGVRTAGFIDDASRQVAVGDLVVMQDLSDRSLVKKSVVIVEITDVIHGDGKLGSCVGYAYFSVRRIA